MNVLITGANKGIGLGFARSLLSQGCEVWSCYRKDPGILKDLSSTSLHPLKWDVSEEQSDEAIAALGLPDKIDLLINNAGVYGPKKDAGQSLASVSATTMHQVFDINCVGALRVVQCLASRIVKAKGIIVNISSKMGSSEDNTSGGCYAYRASKAALLIISRSMAVDLAPDGVRVISLHPGWVRTDMTNHTGLISVEESVTGMLRVIEDVDSYAPGAFVAYDGSLVPY